MNKKDTRFFSMSEDEDEEYADDTQAESSLDEIEEFTEDPEFLEKEWERKDRAWEQKQERRARCERV
ncbi:Hypothetical predicted protein [Cloeon dipterum]|uniref:Uncharacterized protein n=1 Tax=Cloeon dipterum TaxID=197152 RepID=A0A8S1DG75_9INSE|nr:Hypothetical predicted protein [Cloeon dipterum]